MTTAYTIGNQKSYDGYISTIDIFEKLGRTANYEGGWVWASVKDAQTFIDNTELTFSAKVYKLTLPTDWDTDVSKEPSEDGAYRLLHDAKITQVTQPF